jgi:hypothetical protein
MATRGALVNVLSPTFAGIGGADATSTDWLLVESTTVHGVPNAIPASIGGRPILISGNFNDQFVYESAPNTITAGVSDAHLGGQTASRGAVGYSTKNYTTLFPGSATGTAAVIAGGSTLRDNLAIFGLAANGNFLSPIARALPAPAAVLDPDQPAWAPTASAGVRPLPQPDRVPGRLVADLASDPTRLATCWRRRRVLRLHPAVITPFNNPAQLHRGRAHRSDDGSTTWRAAAWTDNTSRQEHLPERHDRDRQPASARVRHRHVHVGADDRLGGQRVVRRSYELLSAPGTVNVGLFRSVWNTSTQAYRIELVLAQGTVIAGRNSGRNYTVSFMPLNDSDSISSGAAWSSNIAESASLNMSTVGLATDDPRTLGGIVISATIVYDNNNDGLFIRSTARAVARQPGRGLQRAPVRGGGGRLQRERASRRSRDRRQPRARQQHERHS